MADNKINFVDFAVNLENVYSVFSLIPSIETDLRNQLSNLDAQEQDLLHEVEIADLSRREKNIYVVKLQELRKKRRNVKNQLELIDPVSKLIKSNSKIVYDLSTLCHKIRDTLKTQDSRVYIPKARTDLKIIKLQNMDAKIGKNGKVVVTTHEKNK